ncbi:MAG: ExbD/TolR family protein [Alphaproteobacteria bacterium]|nr:ExbD/TolR family protein [Alphaproteobacteria bacterium]
MVKSLQNKTRSSGRLSRRNAEINITNLMDVMMVLLVVFMVAAPLMTSGIALDLPKVGGKNLTGKETSLNISVDEQGYYYIGKEEIPADEIIAKVKAVRDANPEISVIISGDTDAHYGRVLGLMALLKNAGFEKVGLKTDPAPNQNTQTKK